MYTETEKQIFGPFDRGDGVMIYVDPIRVRRWLTALLDGRPGKVLETARCDVPLLAAEAEDRVLAASVTAFGLAAFNPATGEGLREDGIRAILNSFLAWWSDLKKKVERTPTSPPSSEQAYSGGVPVTTSFAASGSI